MNLLKDNGFNQLYSAIESIITVLFNAFAIIYFHWLLLAVSILMTALVYFLPKIFENCSDFGCEISFENKNE